MNIDALLAAISTESPGGEDLSFSPEFDAIQELRRADDPTLDQGEWVTTLKSADWAGVRVQCIALLQQRTKDLRVAGWLADAAARLDGYAGLADGLSLCARLCERHWDALHPQVEGGDLEQREGNLRWLLTQVEALAPRLPVLRDAERSYTLQDIAAAQAAPRNPEDGAREPRITPDQIAAARRATPGAFLADNALQAQRAQQALAELQMVVDARMGSEGPAFAGARRALEDAVHAVERMARDANAGMPALAAKVAAGSAPAPAAVASSAAGGMPQSRAEALAQLRAVAEFFRRTEPHSPVAYLAERAAGWGEMPLHAWLRTVLKDAGTLSTLEELLGVAPPPPPAE